MKTLSVLLSTMLFVGTLAAQPPPQRAKQSLKVVAYPQLNESLIAPKPAQPNAIAGHKVVYSGVLVQVAKTKEPWQLINPAAPAEYGSREGNLDRDIITGKPTGFKFFSISF